MNYYLRLKQQLAFQRKVNRWHVYNNIARLIMLGSWLCFLTGIPLHRYIWITGPYIAAGISTIVWFLIDCYYFDLKMRLDWLSIDL